MKQIVYHVVVPAIMPVQFFAVASSPVEVLGCLTRGLIALLIAIVSGLAALGAVIIGTKRRAHNNQNAIWWVISSVILVIPVIAIIILA